MDYGLVLLHLKYFAYSDASDITWKGELCF